MFEKWLAQERLRGDPALAGFWPLAADPRDRSPRGRHAAPAAAESPYRPLFWPVRGRPAMDPRGRALTAAVPNLLRTLDPAAPAARGFTASFWLFGPAGAVNAGVTGQAHGGAGLPFKGWVVDVITGGLTVSVYDDAAAGSRVSFTYPLAHVGRWVRLAVRVRPGTLVAAVAAGGGGAPAGGGVIEGGGGGGVVAAPAYYSTLLVELFADGRLVAPSDIFNALGGPLDAAAADALVLGGHQVDLGNRLPAGAALAMVRLYERPLSSADLAAVDRRDRVAFDPTAPVPAVTPGARSLSLFAAGSAAAAGSVPLLTAGAAAGGAGGSAPFVTAGFFPAAAGPVTLFAGGSAAAAAGVPLWTSAAPAAASPVPLFAFGAFANTAALTFGASGGPDPAPAGTGASAAAAFFARGATGAAFGTPVAAGAVNLTLPAETTGGTGAGVNLVATGGTTPAAAVVPLNIKGGDAEPAGGAVGFALKAERFLRVAGGVALFAQQTVPDRVLFFLQGQGTAAAGGVPLAVVGGAPAAAAVPFALPVVVAAKTQPVRLYTNGW